MKIPHTENVGVFYGNEENQWQNGVMMDAGVGGSGDAGYVHPAVYPVPRPHVAVASPGYVMAGPYYPAPAPAPGFVPPPQPDDFEDYMWMENEEEFDKQVMQQLEEEALMEQCIEAMLEDERERGNARVANGHNSGSSNGASTISLEEQVSKSTLNPLAAEFVPTFARQVESSASNPAGNAQVTEPPDSAGETRPTAEETSTPAEEHSDTEETQTPVVSAADVEPIARDEKAESKRPKEKPKPKAEAPKPKKCPVAAKSETKMSKRKESKRETKDDSDVDGSSVDAKESSPTEECAAFKPINYAAAAKANRPKKPTPPPERPAAPAQKPKPTEKKPEKPLQRKGSAK